jgi:hypothetical protein
LEHLVDEYNLVLKNDGSQTRFLDRNTDDADRISIIDLMWVSSLLAPQVMDWKVLNEDRCATTSDHMVIEWFFQGSNNEVDRSYLPRGWSITEMLGSSDDAIHSRANAGWDLDARMAMYPRLMDASSREELEAEAKAIEKNTVVTFNAHAKVIKLCARSKQCWSANISEKRTAVGRARHLWKVGHIPHAEYLEMKHIWQKAVRDAKRKYWETFLEHAHGSEVCSAVHYTKPACIAAVLMLYNASGNEATDDPSERRTPGKNGFPGVPRVRRG